MAKPSEIDRIRSTYREYDSNPENRSRWGRANPGNLATVLERQVVLQQVLEKAELWPLTNLKLLEVGCGEGGVIGQFLELGASSSNIVGVDLLENRIEKARAKVSELSLLAANAENLPFGDEHFDLVAVFTVFSSILDRDTATRIATECSRVLRTGGGVIWYDFRYNNPNNRHVQGMRQAHIRNLFPGFDIQISKTTLLPPLARRLGRLTNTLYPKLSLIPLLRTHYIGILKK